MPACHVRRQVICGVLSECHAVENVFLQNFSSAACPIVAVVDKRLRDSAALCGDVAEVNVPSFCWRLYCSTAS